MLNARLLPFFKEGYNKSIYQYNVITPLQEGKQHTIKDLITDITRTMAQMDAYSRRQATEELKELRRALDNGANNQLNHKIDELTFLLAQLQQRPNPVCSVYIVTK